MIHHRQGNDFFFLFFLPPDNEILENTYLRSTIEQVKTTEIPPYIYSTIISS